MKILILKPSSLGDVIQALPVARLLKRHFQKSEISWFIDSRLAPLLRGDPDLSEIIEFPRHRWTEPAVWLQMWKTLRAVRRSRFDAVIDLQCLARTAIFAWLAKGAMTIGLDEPREGSRGFYDLAVRRNTFTTHAVDWYLGVLPFLGVDTTWDFQWIPERHAVSARLKEQWPIGDKTWLLLQPGARWLNKRWPLAHFRTVLVNLARLHPNLHFAIMGGAEDRDLGANLASVLTPDRMLDLTGKLSLPEMVEWVRLSTLMISNDTGPMHVAAAVGTPVLSLFGPTEPRRTGPYGQTENCLRISLPCAPCMSARCDNPTQDECLQNLSPGIVISAADRLLTKKPGRRVPLELVR